jgi:hypothetical protein
VIVLDGAPRATPFAVVTGRKLTASTAAKSLRKMCKTIVAESGVDGVQGVLVGDVHKEAGLAVTVKQPETPAEAAP